MFEEYRLNAAINMAQAQIARDYLCYATMDTISVDSSDGAIALPSDFLEMESVFRLMSDTLRMPLKRFDVDSSLQEYDSPTQNMHKKGDPGSPGYWLDWGDVVLFHPKVRFDSTDSATFEIGYYAIPPMVTADTGHLLLPDQYWPELINLTVAMMYRMKGNPEAAAAFADEYARGRQWYWELRMMKESETK
jgi:hypothetical protein